MNITLKLLDTVDKISSHVNAAISEEINDAILKNLPQLQKDLIYNAIPEWLNEQPEIQALRNGKLSGLFGFTSSPLAIADSIINSVAHSSAISVKKYNKNLSGGGLQIAIQQSDFSNLISLPDGHTIYENGDLHWLKWMLLRGDEIIIVGYEYNPRTGIGRTKLGNMKAGQGFRVPPEYSGTAQDNFVTRALTGQKPLDYITGRIKKMLGA